MTTKIVYNIQNAFHRGYRVAILLLQYDSTNGLQRFIGFSAKTLAQTYEQE